MTTIGQSNGKTIDAEVLLTSRALSPVTLSTPLGINAIVLSGSKVDKWTDRTDSSVTSPHASQPHVHSKQSIAQNVPAVTLNADLHCK